MAGRWRWEDGGGKMEVHVPLFCCRFVQMYMTIHDGHRGHRGPEARVLSFWGLQGCGRPHEQFANSE